MAETRNEHDPDDPRTRALRGLSARIGHDFDDLSLLDRALTHASLGNAGRPSYERLEFLGDAVLGFLVADHLYAHAPEVPEGDLTDRRSRIVSREPLAAITRDLGLTEHLEVGRGLRSDELESERIQADLVEAVLAAVYRDGGIRAARKFVRTHVLPRFAALGNGKPKLRDPKSRLLHLAQTSGFGQPRYHLVHAEGPDHERSFTVGVIVGGIERAQGQGRSKQAAEMAAAVRALEILLEVGEAAGERPGS